MLQSHPYHPYLILMQGVVDLSWAPDGLTLLAASTDGSITSLQFTTEDLAPLASKKVGQGKGVPVAVHICLQGVQSACRTEHMRSSNSGICQVLQGMPLRPAGGGAHECVYGKKG